MTYLRDGVAGNLELVAYCLGVENLLDSHRAECVIRIILTTSVSAEVQRGRFPDVLVPFVRWDWSGCLRPG